MKSFPKPLKTAGDGRKQEIEKTIETLYIGMTKPSRQSMHGAAL
jgi:hypothetical protein